MIRRDQLKSYIAILDYDLKQLFKRVDYLLSYSEDTLSEEFQIAADIMSVFEKRAIEWLENRIVN